MRKVDFIHKLAELDRKGIYVLAKRDIERLFPNEDAKALEKSLQRLVADRLLLRVAKGIYLNPYASSRNSWAIEEIAKALRPDSFSYVSLESILSEYGVISQIPISRITIMTTGAKGVFETPFGTIEFTHTKRSPEKLISRTIHDKRRPLRIASKKAAVQDLYRVGRNTNMIDEEELEEEFEP
ncbi:MAG: hypothetical protein HHJ17_15530 [Rhodoferax sp.]|uniref:type IV toxin-antitoxin system AbiEi family antitoxin n=1 Tax=Rhodoferax sp. TaxID=50421 RepID=UPI00180331AD|nr:DUF6088 family protein [Rhodoferax sp.]NMM14931.1 hypothetical protein [Rhodoferax sp.]